MLVDGLKALRLAANLVIVADHGMAATSSDRVVALDKVADPKLYRVVENGPYASLEPTEGSDAALAKALLGAQDHMQCWPTANNQARFHSGAHRPAAPWLCLDRNSTPLT